MAVRIVCKDMKGESDSKTCDCKYVLFCKAEYKSLTRAVGGATKHDRVAEIAR